MSDRHSLATLAQLARQRADEAAKRLGEAIAKESAAKQTLEALHQYRDEYTRRCQNALAEGITPDRLRNHQNFIIRLDTAVRSQMTIVDGARDHVNQLRQQWQKCDQSRLAYDKLYERHVAREQHLSNRREQKATDEQAARRINPANTRDDQT